MYSTGCFWTCWGKFRILLGEQFPQSSQTPCITSSVKYDLENLFILLLSFNIYPNTIIKAVTFIFATLCIENTAEHHPSTMENCQNVVVFLYYFNNCCEPLVTRPNFLPSIVFIEMNKDNIRNCFFNEWIDFFNSGISKKKTKM